MMATQIIYNGTVIGTVTAGQSKILKCNGKKMKSDVEIRAGARTEIKYDGAVIATVEAGKSKTIKCAGITMKSNIEISVEDDTTGKDGVSPTVEMIDIDGGTRIIITDVNGPKSTDIMDGKDGPKGDKGDPGEKGENGAQGPKGDKGDKGDTGAQGAQGIQGIQGEKGADGAKGDKGDKGDPGADGKDGVDGKNGSDGYTPQKGVDYFDGKNGSDGVSPTVSVSKSGKVTTVSITDKNGTKTATINDGSDGASGKDGSNGVGIKSVVQTTTSSADGGNNIITVTKTDNTTSTFTVKNGSKGSTGDAGKDGTSVTVKSVSESTADGGSNVITFSDGKTLTVKNGSKGSAGKDGSDGRNGADGKTPVKGVDYYTEADKAEMVAAVIESLGGNPIFGIVDENNNIIVNGDLPDGTYTVKYEMEGGKIINIGNLVLDSNVYYTVTKNLTNCTISNSATQIVQGGSYAAVISANGGYELKSVSVTMGGSAVSVSGGVINIASVTGNIVITAVAEEATVTPSYTNLLPLSVNADGSDYKGTNGEDGYKAGYKMSGTSGGESVTAGAYCSGFIAIKGTDTVRIKNITEHSGASVNNIIFYDANKTKVYSATGNTAGAGFHSYVTKSNGVYSFNSGIWTDPAKVAFFRFSCGGITDETIVTANEEIV